MEPRTLTSGSAPGSALPGFSEDDCLAGCYRLIRFIAAGCMGEVFEAEDLLLGVRVAIKSIRPDIADDRRALARFRREVLLARRVTHPTCAGSSISPTRPLWVESTVTDLATAGRVRLMWLARRGCDFYAQK